MVLGRFDGAWMEEEIAMTLVVRFESFCLFNFSFYALLFFLS